MPYSAGYGTPPPPARPWAGFWIRFAAAFVDGLILAIPNSIIRAAVDSSFQFTVWFGAGFGGSGPQRQSALVSLLTTLLALAYYAFQEGGPSGQTLGKRLCGIRVIDMTTGGSIGVARAAGRYICSLLSGCACLLGYLWMLWDPQKQTWHDKIIGSNVIRL